MAFNLLALGRLPQRFDMVVLAFKLKPGIATQVEHNEVQRYNRSGRVYVESRFRR